MKSSEDALRLRGFASKEDRKALEQCSVGALLKALENPVSVVRTAAAGHLSTEEPAVVEALLQQLSREACLYTRLAICDTLRQGDAATARQMADWLGKIGDNLYNAPPAKVSAKKSFPLPRDLVARTLGKMEPEVLPVLLECLHDGDIKKVSEALDALGYLVFYQRQLASPENVLPVLQVLEDYPKHPLLTWKVLLCLAAFPVAASEEVLQSYLQDPSILGQQARKSMSLWQQAERNDCG